MNKDLAQEIGRLENANLPTEHLDFLHNGTPVRIYFEGQNLPEYKTKGSSGMDLHANIDKGITLAPLGRVIIPTGIFIELPIGLEAQIRPRSGTAIKHGITLVNCVGTIDSDYRGEVGLLVINLSDSHQLIEPQERIAQMVIAEYKTINWERVNNREELNKTVRGDGGYGSTGK